MLILFIWRRLDERHFVVEQPSRFIFRRQWIWLWMEFKLQFFEAAELEETLNHVDFQYSHPVWQVCWEP